jgi:hypothetical protein
VIFGANRENIYGVTEKDCTLLTLVRIKVEFPNSSVCV